MYACMSMLQCKVWSPYQSPRQNKKWTFKLNRASNWNWRQQENYRLINWCLSSTWGVSEKFLEKRPWLWQTLGQTWGVIYTQRSPCVKSSTQCRPPPACDDYRHCYHFGCFSQRVIITLEGDAWLACNTHYVCVATAGPRGRFAQKVTSCLSRR